MIQEPARAQATTYEAQQSNVATTGERIYSSNCNCSQKRTKQTVPTTDSPMLTLTTKTTTIPIVINTLPNPRIILIKVPTQNSSNTDNSKSDRTEPSAPRTRLIRIPFLPGSVPATASVKRALPTASSSVNFTTSATASRIVKDAIKSTGTIYPQEQCSNSSNSQLNRVNQNDPTTTSTTVTQTVQVSSTPQTLASMAGIQLTGADMQSPQDMSGAMPTATVEEIDVPVFIDEYLQNIEASLSTSSNNKSEEIGTEILTETDKFDFDFDINLIAEDLIECKEMDQCNLGMDRNNSDYYNCDLINMDTTDFQQFEDGEELALDMNSMCKGIDINSNLREDFSLENILTNSENPMLANFSQGSISNSQVTKEFTELPMLANENSMENSSYGFSQPLFGSGHLDGVNEDVCHLVAMPDGMPTLGVKRTASAATISVAESMPQKRIKLGLNINKSQISHSDVINTPTIIEQMLNFDELNFANTTSTRDEIYEDLRNTEDISSITILPDYCTAPNTPNSTYSVGIARSPEPTCQLGFGGFITAPVSPAFSTASTSQFSVTTSTTDKSKRKRGRPAKEHADGPDPELMSRMTHEEAKLYLDRLKNNEASRVSRKKTKKREEEEVKDEDALIAKNHELREQLQRLKHRSQKIVDFLNQNHHKRSTYIKPEPGH
ncbi:uncharacterized protein LOC6563635 [Drosophila grimshawi]|uniref:uncharacterized protein LOC6563635 n=1 Tax=Drosophila grimshawi TaxID=7222 RepID=UPI000C870032|nr:uncharacterized protein LOC6563635 [Drosophila grimshawi]XP_032593463.1 uncharacterized protein LOC6563635 [Drosophila grimshawi]